jgi:putative membrane protein
MLILLLIVVVAFVAVLRTLGGGIRDAAKETGTSEGGRTARRILDERYARGELARDEYERMRRDIEAD